MFSKFTVEQKEAMRLKFAAAISSGFSSSSANGKVQTSDNDSADDDGTAPLYHGERSKHAGEVLRVNANSQVVEITNARLFTLDELDLASLASCTTLSLRKNLIHDLSPFPLHLANRLMEMDLFDNKIKTLGDFFASALVEDANSGTNPPIKQSFPNPFASLTKLDLSYNQVRVIGGLDALAPTLKELYLVENKIKVIQGLDALSNLELLELGGNRIREIGNGLRSLINLKQLWLGKNKIVSIGTSLRTLRSLELLSLQANRIRSVEAECFTHSSHPCLMELYLSENGLMQIENLPLHNLRTLDFSFNPIEHINEAVINNSSMGQLQEFWLTDGNISDWSEVQKLSCFEETLRTVYLERNPIEQDKRYRNKVYMYLPFVTQIDSWPLVNLPDLEADRKIERANPVD